LSAIDSSKAKKPLTLTLSQRERGLTEVFIRIAPTYNCESNSGSKSLKVGPLSLGRGLG
jgi:hypothetical protein